MATQIDLLPSQASIRITANDGLETYIKKSDVIKVVPINNTDLVIKTGAARNDLFKIYITLTDGSTQEINLSDVSNQPTWTIDTAGINQAAYDIAQTFQPAATPTDPLEVTVVSPDPLPVDGGQSFDALGAVEVSQLTTQIDLKQSTGELTEYIDTKTVAGGSYSYDASTGSTSLNVTASSGDRVVSQTFQRTNYQTGKPKQIKQTIFNFHPETNVVKRFGYYSAEYGTPYNVNYDGFFFMSDSTNGVTLNVYNNGTQVISRPQSEWNGDYDFDSIDWGYNILAISRFVWLGIDQVQFSVKIGAEKVVLHTEYFQEGTMKGVYMRYSNQPLRWEIESTGGAGSMNYICATAEKQGSLNQLGELKGIDRGSTHQNANNIANTYANIGIALDETKTANFRGAVIDIVNAVALGLTADDLVIRIYRNPTITGTALSWQQIPDSSVKYFIGADDNLITAGTGAILYTDFAARRESGGALIENAIKMGIDLDGNPDVFVLGIQPLTPNLDVVGGLNFRELS